MESGQFTLTQQQISDGTVTVTPTVQPMVGIADVRRTFGSGLAAGVNSMPLAVEVNGANLLIRTIRAKAGDLVVWISYSE